MQEQPTPSQCRQEGRCLVLSSKKGKKGSDAPLPVAHFRCILRDFGSTIRFFIRGALALLPFGRVGAKITERCWGIPCAGREAARAALTRDVQLGEDISQEVAILLWQAISRGDLPAARPVIYKWLQTTTRWVTWRNARPVARHYLFAAPARDDDSSVVDVPVSCHDPRAASSSTTDEQARYRTAMRAHPNLYDLLTYGQREVFVPWLTYRRASEIAREFGITAVAVRLRLMYARRRIDTWLNGDTAA